MNIHDIQMRTMCVGRFLIDVIADAELSYRGVMIAGWNIATVYDETDEQFGARMVDKEARLALEKNSHGLPSLERTYAVDKNGVHGKIQVFGRKWIPNMPAGLSGESVMVEAMIRVEDRSFDLTIEYANDKDVAALAELVTQFRARDDDDVPHDPGFCFDGGFIADPIYPGQKERVTMFVGLKRHRDVSMVIDMTAGITISETLLERHNRNTVQQAHPSRFHTFKIGPRFLNGQLGDEVLQRVHEFNGNYGHSFMWETVHNSVDSVYTPEMSFEMSTGHGQAGKTVNASLTDAEALALWERTLSSLRIRPVVSSKTSPSAPI